MVLGQLRVAAKDPQLRGPPRATQVYRGAITGAETNVPVSPGARRLSTAEAGPRQTKPRVLVKHGGQGLGALPGTASSYATDFGMQIGVAIYFSMMC